MKRIAIIPARGGSKRIPNKNIRDFCGKPMISYILNEAIKSNLFDKIHVSTDSEQIANIVFNLEFSIDFMRPAYLSDDFTPLQPVIEYVLKNYANINTYYDELWLLLPCSPLIEANDLIEASKFMKENQISNNGLIAVVEYSAPIDWAYGINTSGILIPIEKEKLFKRSQDLDKRYHDSGTFMSFCIDNHSDLSNPKVINDSFLGYKISKFKGIDIDTNEDWELVENIYHTMKNKK